MNLIKLLKNGQEYMRIFPKEARFKITFPEIRIITLTHYSMRFMPPSAILIFLWQYFMHAPLILSVITILFALSLPLQGLFFLGKRAQMQLPLTLLCWFNELKHNLTIHHIIGEKTVISPTFMELIKLLNLSKQYLGYYPRKNCNN